MTLQVCRHPDPRLKFPVGITEIRDGDENRKIEVVLPAINKLIKEGAITSRKIKVGNRITYDGKTYKITRFTYEDCKFLERKNNRCSLPDSTKCPGCTVLNGYADIEEVKHLAKVRVDLVQKERVEAFINAVTESEATSEDQVENIINTTRALLLRFAPWNRMTLDFLKYKYRDDYESGRIEIDEFTHEIYKCSIDDESGEIIRDQHLGVLRYDPTNLYALRQDLISLSGLMYGLGEAVAKMGQIRDQAETTYKQVRSEAWIEAESLIAGGALPFRSTDETITSLVRSSEAYAESKELEQEARKRFFSVKNLQDSVKEVINTVKHQIKSLELEIQMGLSNQDV